MSASPYTSLPGFQHVFLEDSFVLGIEARPGLVVFAMDVVLTPPHPAYRTPGSDKHHCYRPGHIEFRHVRMLTWIDQGIPPARDASGEVDYGAIETLVADGLTFSLQGDWGRMNIASALPVLRLE